MSETENTNQNETIDTISISDLGTHRSNDGASFQRVPVGDYKARIADITAKTKDGKNPHRMIMVDFEITQAYDKENTSAVGSRLRAFYAASNESPKFLKERLVCLLNALKIGASNEVRTASMKGREIDFTVVWECSKGKDIDLETGEAKTYVNDRVKGERPVGTPRSKGLNPQAESRKAVAFLEGEGQTTSTPSDATPWEAGTSETPTETVVTEDASGTVDERTATIHAYRAVYQMGADKASKEYALSALTDIGEDASGPVDASLLAGDIADSWAKFVAARSAAPQGLPPLSALPGGKGVKKPNGKKVTVTMP